MRLVFAGSPDAAVPSLEALHRAGHEIALVITQPDARGKRGSELHPTPVRVAAEALGLDLQPALRLAASVVLIVAGLIVPILAWFEWGRAERALRTGSSLPGAATSIALAVTIVVVGVLVLLGVLLP